MRDLKNIFFAIRQDDVGRKKIFVQGLLADIWQKKCALFSHVNKSKTRCLSLYKGLTDRIYLDIILKAR